MKPVYLRSAFVFLMIIWCGGFSIPLFLPKADTSVLSLIFNHLYDPVCHQAHSKSFQTASGYFLVCARCTGIYAGALTAAFYMLIFPNFRTFPFISVLILLAADVLLVNMNIYEYSKGISFTTGLLFGFTIIPYIFSPLEKSLCTNDLT